MLNGIKEHACCAGIVSVFLIGSTRTIAGDATLERSPEAVVEAISKQLADIERCSLRANVRVEFFQQIDSRIPVNVQIDGFFAFDADGEKWRKRSYLDAAKYPQMNTDIAYNGEVYQYADTDSEHVSLSFSGPEEKNSGMCLPNPLVALGQCMLSDDADSPHDVTLSNLRTASVELKVDDFTWEELPEKHKGSIAGGMFGNESYTNSILIPKNTTDTLVMERSLAQNGQVLLRTTFSEWYDEISSSGHAQAWPHSVVFETFHPKSGDRVGMMRMTITTLSFQEANSPFLIDLNDMKSVWIDDSNRFLK